MFFNVYNYDGWDKFQGYRQLISNYEDTKLAQKKGR